MELAEQLSEPIFTPSTKAARGDHDENIPMEEVERLVGAELAEKGPRHGTGTLCQRAAAHARKCGIIIADTKFEFGTDANGQLRLIDEIFTPDSSRFWPADRYAPGSSPASFDKQYVRDYLETLDWDKRAPGPRLPAAVIEGTRRKYREALDRLTGQR